MNCVILIISFLKNVLIFWIDFFCKCSKPLKSILQSPNAPANDPDKQAIRIRFRLTAEQEWNADCRPYRSTYPEMKRRRNERKRLQRMMEAMEATVVQEKLINIFLGRWGNILKLEIKWEGSGFQGGEQ